MQTGKGEAETAREAAGVRLAEVGEARNRLRAQDAALHEGPEVRDARELERAAQDADGTREAQQRAEADRSRAEQVRARAEGRLATDENRLATASATLVATRAQGSRSAQAAHLEAPYLDEARQESPKPEMRRAAEESLARGQRALAHMTELAEAVGHAEAEYRGTARRGDEADSDLARATEWQEKASEAVTHVVAKLLSDVREHLTACTELAVPDLIGLLDRLQVWTDQLDGPYPAEAEAVHRELAAELADENAALIAAVSAGGDPGRVRAGTGGAGGGGPAWP
ncbi:hypothetical protein [Streptomyces sp. NRRL S-1868]|uniref:hypothetical protein n=1 Tax=Streptomyces sp. NRRL S-1868 TaxID=1463892 RepID=UPI0007C6491A|nr:hypothetical protein [Streptomyces sp. NRRL S-1868]